MCHSKARRRLLLSGLLLLVASTATQANVRFYLERYGSPHEKDFDHYVSKAGIDGEQDFEDPALLSPENFPITTMPVGDFTLGIAAGMEHPLQLYVSPEFDAPGMIFHRALVADVFLTITPDPGQPVAAIGTWIFDDGGGFDSAYLIEVIESDGSMWQAVLENEIGLDFHGHEIEGFFGVVSDVGIAELTITAIDPATGEASLEGFEIDHLMVTGMLDTSKKNKKGKKGK